MTNRKLNRGAALLRIWLVKQGVPQSTFANTVKVSNATMISYSAGRTVPTIEIASRISEATGDAVKVTDWNDDYTGALSKVPTFRRGRRSASVVA